MVLALGWAFLIIGPNPGGLKRSDLLFPFPLDLGMGLALGSACSSLCLENWAVLEEAGIWLAEVPLG